MSGDELIEHARSFIGSPFRHGEMDPKLGCDCAGLILGAARAAGITDKLLPTYGPETPPDVLLETLTTSDLRLVYFGCGPGGLPSRQILEEGWSAAEPGDVLILMVAAPRGRPHPRHLSYWSGNSLIHAEGNSGVVEMPLDAKWKRRLHSIWRWRGLDDE